MLVTPLPMETEVTEVTPLHIPLGIALKVLGNVMLRSLLNFLKILVSNVVTPYPTSMFDISSPMLPIASNSLKTLLEE